MKYRIPHQRFINEPISNWGNYLYVKTNAVDCFSQEYKKLISKNGIFPTILLSFLTDAYQSAEKKYRLTRGILEILSKTQYQGRVSILTKSPLVLRDVDLLTHLPSVEVGLTVTTTDDKISRSIEMRAPIASNRIKTLRHLAKQGIRTYAFIGPLLPHYLYVESELHNLIKTISEVGVSSVYVEHINLSSYILERLKPILHQCDVQIQQQYKQTRFAEYRKALDEMVYSLLEQYGIALKLNRTLYHSSDK